MRRHWPYIAAPVVFLVGISALHVWLNIGFHKLFSGPQAERTFRVGFLPVT